MRNSRFWRLLACSFFVVLLPLLALTAQESKQQPAQPPATPVQPTNSRLSNSIATPPEIEYLQDLAAQLFRHADKVGCKKGGCSILVMNFVLPDGLTSRYGMQLADELSSEIAKQQKSVRMIDRTLLQSALERERIPPQLQDSVPVVRWLAKGLNADVTLVGTTRNINKNVVQLSARLLSVKDEKRIGPSVEVNLSVNDKTADLAPMESLPTLPPIAVRQNLEKISDLRASGVSRPSCFYMPSPIYTDEARKANFSGIIIEEGIIHLDGSVTPTRLVKGAPFGLNETALSSMATWKCHPATYNGKPVSALVTFEVNFRRY